MIRCISVCSNFILLWRMSLERRRWGWASQFSALAMKVRGTDEICLYDPKDRKELKFTLSLPLKISINGRPVLQRGILRPVYVQNSRSCCV